MYPSLQAHVSAATSFIARAWPRVSLNISSKKKEKIEAVVDDL
jgi:hypothetical protein